MGLVERFLEEANAKVVPIDRKTEAIAVTAFAQFGKGRHEAELNMGDCFAYAGAVQLDEPLLCKGNDFPRTDVALGRSDACIRRAAGVGIETGRGHMWQCPVPSPRP